MWIFGKRVNVQCELRDVYVATDGEKNSKGKIEEDKDKAVTFATATAEILRFSNRKQEESPPQRKEKHHHFGGHF